MKCIVNLKNDPQLAFKKEVHGKYASQSYWKDEENPDQTWPKN